jgi:copper homeostasis protein CutC
VMEGLQQLAGLVAEGGSRISVMPGGGVTADNAVTVARVTGGCPVIAQAGWQQLCCWNVACWAAVPCSPC